jgi:transcriptional regulator with XRE-family HTH domain
VRRDRLKQLRVKHGYSQEALAEMLNLGSRQIWRYENGQTSPDGQIVAKIAQVFDVSTDYLLGLTDDPTPYHRTSVKLSEKERAVVAAMRRGEPLEAVRVIISDDMLAIS